MGRQYSGDPYWLTCRYNGGTCARTGCDHKFRRGDRAFRFKNGAMYCAKPECGEAESRSFECAAFDEAVYNRDWGTAAQYAPR